MDVCSRHFFSTVQKEKYGILTLVLFQMLVIPAEFVIRKNSESFIIIICIDKFPETYHICISIYILILVFQLCPQRKWKSQVTHPS